MGAVRGVILDESALLADGVAANDAVGDPYLRPAAETLLRRLRYSDLRVAICHHENVSDERVALLKRTAEAHALNCILLHGEGEDASLNQMLVDWTISGETCFLVTSRKESSLWAAHDERWIAVCIGDDECGCIASYKTLVIKSLEELPITICSFSKKEMLDPSVIIIGYIMKSSRENDFAKRGAFPMYPTPDGLMFVPLSFEISLEPQLQRVNAVLHKATDEIIAIDPIFSTDPSKGITFSKGLAELKRYMQEHPDCHMIDSLVNIYPLLDRYKIQEILFGLHDLNVGNQGRVRGPKFVKVDNFHNPNLREELSEANLSFPIIVKPQVACGVADAHNMALVFKFEDLKDLQVPLPAILQEYVDHGSTIFKFYVLGDRVFHAVKRSMPNASSLVQSLEKTGLMPVIFNSLKSLPVATEDQLSSIESLKERSKSLYLNLVCDSANRLQEKLKLTIFGFDVVIQEGSGDHVIVDLNYLPSFKEVPDNEAVPAFWRAIFNTCRSKNAVNS